MSLTALIFNHTNFICLSEDLIEITNILEPIRIRLFHSHLTEAFLLLTDLTFGFLPKGKTCEPKLDQSRT